MSNEPPDYAKNLHNWLMRAKKEGIQTIENFDCESASERLSFRDKNIPNIRFELILTTSKIEKEDE